MRYQVIFSFYFLLVLKAHAFSDHTEVLNRVKLLKFNEISKNDPQKSVLNNAICDQELLLIQQGLESNEPWAIRLIDTWAKVRAGYLSGNLINIGDFDSCVRFEHRQISNRMLRGQYCLVALSALQNSTLTDDRTDLSLKHLANFFRANQIVAINGFCVPASCSPTRAVEFLNEQFLFNNDLVAFGASCRDLEIKFEPIDYFAITIFSIILLLIIASTIYEIIVVKTNNNLENQIEKPEPNKLLASMSVYTNGYNLFDVKKIKSPSSINCIHGIRVLSILWIILGHRVALQFPWGNPIDQQRFMTENILAVFLLAYHLAVDTFLLMGALLMTWSTLRDCEKKQLNILRLIWRRYLRYTLVLAALVLGAVSVFRFFLRGPLFLDALRDNCINNWWWVMLHIQNYLPESEMCLNHSWYLSLDFQLFIISPFIIYLIHKFGAKLISVPAILCIATMVYIFSIAMVLNIEMPTLATMPDYERLIYFPTQSRAGPWFIGIILGYFLYIKKGQKIIVNKYFNAIMWIISLSTLCTIAFLTYGFHSSTSSISIISHATFMALQRNLWTIAICWIVIACQNIKTGGVIRWFLSLPQWQPFSRMGLSIYLTSATYQVLMILNQRNPIYMTFWNVIPVYLSDVTMSIILSIIFYLAFEAPPLIIETYVYKKIKNK